MLFYEYIPTTTLSPTHILPPYASRPSAWKRSVLQCDEDKIRISPARVAKGYFSDKPQPKAALETIFQKHKRQLIAPLWLHSPFPKSPRPANNLFPLHGRSSADCFHFEKAGRCCLSLDIVQANGKTMRLVEDVLNNLTAFRHAGMRMPAAHRPDFRVARLFINRFGIGQRPRAED